MEEFQKLHNELHDLLKNGKYDELEKYFFDDSVVINPMHEAMTIAEIKAAKQDGKFPKAPGNPVITQKVAEVKFFGELAIDRGNFNVKTDCCGEKNGSYLNVWKKADNGWKILYTCSSERVPMCSHAA